MKMAFSDVSSKAAIISKNDKHFTETLKLEGLSVYSQILKEVELEVVKCNGKTNHKTLKNYKQVKNSWEATYISSGRSIVRMWWFSNFMCMLFELLINKPDQELPASVSEAYEAHLAPNHAFMVKCAARTAFNFSGTKAQAYVHMEV